MAGCRHTGICKDQGDSSGGLLVSQDVPQFLTIYANIKFQWVVCAFGQNLSYHLIMLDVRADFSLLDSLITFNCLLTLILYFSFSYTHKERERVHKSIINDMLYLFLL